MKHIFISHSARDTRHLTTMRDNLLRIGYHPWIDPNPRPGQDWRFAIDDALLAADAVIVIVTPAAADSVYVTYEWSLALGAGIPVIPVVFKRAKMHPRLQALEHFDYQAWESAAQFWDYFTRELQRMLDIAPQNEAIVPPSAPPAPAPRPVRPAAEQPYTRSMMPQDSGYWLVVRRGPSLNTTYRLEMDRIVLGRDASNDITIDDPEVSRQHLRLLWQGDGYAVEDLGSTNGTRINGGQRIQQATRLHAGNALMLGDTIILSYEVV
jgi:hypothetical protein